MKTLLIAILATMVLRPPHRDESESYEWVAGEIRPSDPGWAPRVSSLLRHAPRA